MVRNSCRFRSIVESIVGCYFWATVIVSQMVGVGSFQERRTISPLTCHLNKLLQFSQPKLITCIFQLCKCLWKVVQVWMAENLMEDTSVLKWHILCGILTRHGMASWMAKQRSNDPSPVWWLYMIVANLLKLLYAEAWSLFSKSYTLLVWAFQSAPPPDVSWKDNFRAQEAPITTLYIVGLSPEVHFYRDKQMWNEAYSHKLVAAWVRIP